MLSECVPTELTCCMCTYRVKANGFLHNIIYVYVWEVGSVGWNIVFKIISMKEDFHTFRFP